MDYLHEAKKIISGCLFIPIEKIADDADLNTTHAMDSINFALIVAEVENFIKAEVDPLDILEMRTVSDLAAVLQRGVR